MLATACSSTLRAWSDAAIACNLLGPVAELERGRQGAVDAVQKHLAQLLLRTYRTGLLLGLGLRPSRGRSERLTRLERISQIVTAALPQPADEFLCLQCGGQVAVSVSAKRVG